MRFTKKTNLKDHQAIVSQLKNQLYAQRPQLPDGMEKPRGTTISTMLKKAQEKQA